MMGLGLRWKLCKTFGLQMKVIQRRPDLRCLIACVWWRVASSHPRRGNTLISLRCLRHCPIRWTHVDNIAPSSRSATQLSRLIRSIRGFMCTDDRWSKPFFWNSQVNNMTVAPPCEWNMFKFTSPQKWPPKWRTPTHPRTVGTLSFNRWGWLHHYRHTFACIFFHLMKMQIT